MLPSGAKRAEENGDAMGDPKEGSRPQDIRVIDRRMFTPDGAPRHPDAPREEAAPAPVAHGHSERPGRALPDSGATAPTSQEEQVAGAHFKNLVLNLATTAAANLGEIPNPFSRETEVDMEGARQIIDLLQALRLKTLGNLAPDENELLDSLLYDLRAKFVSLQKKSSKKS
jgi:hypothetical protein